MHGCGDVDEMVTLQSVTKALFYGINLDTLGQSKSSHNSNYFRVVENSPVINHTVSFL